jgi:hypothetical protein
MSILGRYDLTMANSSLSRFASEPREGHLAMAVGVIGYLRNFPDLGIAIDPRDFPNIPPFDENQRESLRSEYGTEEEEISPNDPVPRGRPLTLTVMSDSDWAHDVVTRRSISGVAVFIGRTMVYAKASRQTGIAASSFSAEMAAGRTASQIARGFRNALRSFGIKVEGPTPILGDNLGAIQNVTLLASPLKARHTSIGYHFMRESQAVGATSHIKVPGPSNSSDFFTKSNSTEIHHRHVDSIMTRGGRLPPFLGRGLLGLEDVQLHNDLKSGKKPTGVTTHAGKGGN